MSASDANTSTKVMGPEAPELRAGSMPPSWDGVDKPFRQYIEELQNWRDFTTLKEERQAPAVIIHLSGEPKQLALTISREVRKTAGGLDKIIKKFEEVYSSTDEQDMYYWYKRLTKFRRTEAQSIQDYISGFTARAEKLKSWEEVKIPEKFFSMMMIDYALLTSEQENNLFGAASGQLDFVKISRALKLVVQDSESSTSTPAYVIANAKNMRKKFCRYCKKKGHDISECWKLQKRKESENNRSSKDVRGSWKFPVFTKSESLLVNPIIDSAAGTSVIGLETLNEYCNILEIKDLQKEEPMESTHRFGLYGTALDSLYSVHIPLPLQKHKVTVQANVLSGAHPFLIGARTQEKMKAILNFSKKTWSIWLGSKEVITDLIKPDQHLLLPLKGNRATFMTSKEESIDFKKLHVNTGHSSFDNMKKLLKHADRWRNSYS